MIPSLEDGGMFRSRSLEVLVPPLLLQYNPYREGWTEEGFAELTR